MKNPFLKDEGTTVATTSPLPIKEENISIDPPTSSSSPPVPFHKPNKGRLVIRFWQVIATIGAIGFQIGASTYSGIPYLFNDIILQYYTYVIELLSLIWSLFMIFIYLTRRLSTKATKVKRPIAFAVDTIFTGLFGIASFYQLASYSCPIHQYNGWCDFHNTGKFFLISLFLSFTIMMSWDLFGGCHCLRKKNQDIHT